MFLRYLAFGKQPLPRAAGFSLIELLVSIGILVLILATVLTKQQSFNSSVVLRGQAYELALVIRELQLSAVSSLNTDDSSGEEFRSVLGVHLETSNTNNQRYVLFIDDGNVSRRYHSTDSLFGPIGRLDSRFEIRAIRHHDSTITNHNRVSITFERPDFDAVFRSTGSAEYTGSYQIDIGAAGGSGTSCPEDIRTVEVTATGQISVLTC